MGVTTVAALCVGGLCFAFPRSDFYHKYKVRKTWKNIMIDKKIKNSFNETFAIKKVDLSIKDKTKLSLNKPVGLTLENLNTIKRDLEFSFCGDVEIKGSKYDELIYVSINKNQKNDTEKIKSRWADIMLEKNVRNKFGESFRVKNVTMVSPDSYDLHIEIPVGLSNEELTPLIKIIECNLSGNARFKWKKYGAEIIVTINKNQK